MRGLYVSMVALLVLAGCSTDRPYAQAGHDEVVQAVITALGEEGHVKADKVTKTEDKLDGDERRTRLEGAYSTFSKFRVDVISKPGKDQGQPVVEAKLQTRETLYTRHRDFEDRLLERVALHLNKTAYGEQSRPTALPPEPIPEPGRLSPDNGRTPEKK